MNRMVPGRALNLGHASQSTPATPASMAWTAEVSSFVLHYLKIPTGGAFRIKVDLVPGSTIDTANANEKYCEQDDYRLECRGTSDYDRCCLGRQ